MSELNVEHVENKTNEAPLEKTESPETQTTVTEWSPEDDLAHGTAADQVALVKDILAKHPEFMEEIVAEYAALAKEALAEYQISVAAAPASEPIPDSDFTSGAPNVLSTAKTVQAAETMDTIQTAPTAASLQSPVRSWFFTLMYMNLPIIGWIYLSVLAFSKKQTDRHNFARAYLFYKLMFLIAAAVILGIAVYIGMGILDEILAYMEML